MPPPLRAVRCRPIVSSAHVRRLLPRRNLAASVYGTVLVSSVIVGLGQAKLSAVEMMIAIAVTSTVFALAHAWSIGLARSASDREALRLDHMLEGVEHEWPMVLSAIPALVALALAALDVYSAKSGLWIAIVANTLLLFCWGAILRHQGEATSTIQSLAAGLTTASLGLVLVVLKALVH